MSLTKGEIIDFRLLKSQQDMLAAKALSDARYESDYAPYVSFSQEDITPYFPKPKNSLTLSSV